MGIAAIAAVANPQVVSSLQGPKLGFEQIFKGAQCGQGAEALREVSGANNTLHSQKESAPGARIEASGLSAAKSVEGSGLQNAGRVVEGLQNAQARMDQVLNAAQSGKVFSPAELLAMQSQMYSASQQLELASKAVEKVTGGLKQVLQTQL